MDEGGGKVGAWWGGESLGAWDVGFDSWEMGSKRGEYPFWVLG